MTIARKAAKNKRTVKVRVVDVTGLTVYPPPDGKGIKHFNFRPQGKDNLKGGLYYEADVS